MSISTSRWTLMQALAWVATQDLDFVEIAGQGLPAVRGADDGPQVLGPFTPSWLIAATAGRGRTVTADRAWRDLAGRIADGSVIADGRPARPNRPLGDRQRLTIEASDLEVDGDRGSIDRRCYLAGDSDEQQSWFDVGLDAASVIAAFPVTNAGCTDGVAEPEHAPDPSRETAAPAANKGGRPEQYDWDRIRAHAAALVAAHGFPGRGNKQLPTRAELERSVLNFCEYNLPKAPSEERVRTKVREWLIELRAKAAS